MTTRISCCIQNLARHQYGAQLNELAAEGADIQLESCQAQCAGCRRQPAFVMDGAWHGVSADANFKAEIQASARGSGTDGS